MTLPVPEALSKPALGRLSRSVGGRLFAALAICLLAVFGILGYLNVRLHRQNLEQATLAAAERVSDVIKRSTSYCMMHNDRDGLYQIIRTFASEPGMVRVRIMNQEGRISYSTRPDEVNTFVNKDAEACYGCHAHSEPLTRLDRPDRFRIYQAGKQRVLGIITPIANTPECANADCHAHPASQTVLGVLDTDLSLAGADAYLAASTRQMLLYSVLGLLAIAAFSGLFVWRILHRPVRALKKATERLAAGELGYQASHTSNDELGDLADSFNRMSRELRDASDEITAWNRTLEERVEQKTAELKRVHLQMLQAEKLSSLGKMSAVVAHEINNPLSAIVTYARLVRKWVERGGEIEKRTPEIRESLQLIESESRRCGDIVKHLLMFARENPVNFTSVDLNLIVRRCLRLVEHKLELNNITLELNLREDNPLVHGDAAQLEQLLLALVMNAIEAMESEGRLRLTTTPSADRTEVSVAVADDGCGISEDVKARLFEPFVTTKDHAHGVGLGLAICRNIVDVHHGRIDVQSEPGKGTCFTVHLPAVTEVGVKVEATLAG